MTPREYGANGNRQPVTQCASKKVQEMCIRDSIWDYYPYWHNWITFTLEAGVTTATPKQYEDFL